MKNKTFKIILTTILIGVVAIILLQVYFLFFYANDSNQYAAKEFFKKLNIWEKKYNNVKIVDGNYLSRMIDFDTKKIKGKNYKIITGWFNYYDLQIANNHLAVAYSQINGDMFEYDSTLAIHVDNVTVLENNRNKPFDIKYLEEIKNDGLWTFKYSFAIDNPEENPKLILQKPKKTTNSLIAKYFYWVVDERYSGQILNIEKSYEWWMDLQESDELLFLEMDKDYENDVKIIKDDNYVIGGSYNEYVPAILKRTRAIWENKHDNIDGETNYYIKVKGAPRDYDFDCNTTINDSLVRNYKFSGDYLCSNFNDFCFLYVKDIIYNSKFVLNQDDGTVYINNFDYNDVFRESDGLSYNLVFSIERDELTENYFISRQEPISIDSLFIKKINVNKFVDSNTELKERLGKLREKNTEIIFKYDYNLSLTGSLICEDIQRIRKLYWLECILQPDSLTLERVKFYEN